MDRIDLLFNKHKADQRKEWLENYNEHIYVDHD